jgi:hypothetical protein
MDHMVRLAVLVVLLSNFLQEKAVEATKQKEEKSKGGDENLILIISVLVVLLC